MNTVLFLRLLPGAVLLLAATVALQSPPARTSLASIVPAVPYAVLGGGILLGWRFRRSRLVLALLMLLVADRALVLWPADTAVGRVVLHAVSVLVPINLAALSWMSDRGWLTGRVGGVLLLLQAAGVAALCQPLLLPVVEALEAQLAFATFVGFDAVPHLGVLAFAAGFGLTALRALVHQHAIESGAMWTVIAAFLGLAAGGGLETTVYLATGGLVLVLSLIETWHAMAYMDELTALPGRRALNEALTRLRGTYTVAMVDIDHFKRFNDEHGHDVGDQLLRMIGTRLGDVGGGGRAFRYGGEEFALVFAGRALDDVTAHLEILRKTIESSGFTVRGAKRPRKKPERVRAGGSRRSASVTVSIGAAESAERYATAHDVVKAADEALYRAKRAGRNRVRTDVGPDE